jgi:L-asparaginase
MRLLLIHTGGTLMMGSGGGQTLHPDVYTRDLLAELPVLKTIGDIETQILFNLDSCDMQPHHWVELARVVHDALPDYDGIVVIHGTDTMAYTASALAFLLPGLDRSVVFTGSQRPLEDIRTDARSNLVDACQVAGLGVPEVGIVFRSQLLRGCRARKLDAWSLSAFGSPSCPPLAELGLGFHVAPHVLAKRPAAPFDPRIEDRVLAVRTFPGLDPKLLHGALAAGVRGMVIEAFGTGNIPHQEKSLVPVIEAAKGLDVPVVIVSQCGRGEVDLARYDAGVEAASIGAIGAGDMTPEAALCKLMIALGRAAPAAGQPTTGRIKAARDAFAHVVCGEMSVR